MELNPVLGPGDCPQSGLWYVISSMGLYPSVRVGHTCSYLPGKTAADKGRLVVIGGADPSGAYAETYLLDLDSYQWTTPDYSGLRPRYEHAVFQPVSQPNKIFVFGGADQGRNMNDLQVLDVDAGKWNTVTVTGTPPSPRTCRNCASLGDKLYVFGGGHQGAEPVSDRQLYVFDAESVTWTCPEVKGKKPSCRHGHVMVAVGTKIYLHGGMAREIFLNDLHEFDTKTLTWKQVRCKGDIPVGCTAHGAVAVGDKMFIFGGMTPNGALDTTYVFNTSNLRWQRVKIDGAPPACRLDFAVCSARLYYDVVDRDDTSSASLEAAQKLATVLGGDLKCGMEDNDRLKSETGDGVVPESSKSLEGAVTQPLGASGDTDNPEGECELDRVSPAEGACGSTAGGEVGTASPDEGAVAVASPSGNSQGNCVVCVVHGGMDTEGLIFDDCLVLRLDNL
ncbi:rab9 effector protein with kelch motifs-like [Acanthaster planci]|uniref:Rab9 effector protein with kelch motifs n=1 Tax=Acanthaster planci TaxID=133434 RepID=A0A8B7YM64_ACAPL|nr:rab9 effector protein with kelch motifs-like [Acanthaster planci]XP_022094353.1 rab9 effector protein with kelch motifs-like [Acanthaster planci]XP_022094354.1 rab9 effector protein with kelch motifs-like [Acanthaster planci]XP_022094357.1 rab9 effector protein with kelch motifs-like [Acanthaster planci]XP_022094358.1 rab9 effector protein with kelch motifs-like [Acanthaster planci]